jgi:hypothetical protein
MKPMFWQTSAHSACQYHLGVFGRKSLKDQPRQRKHQSSRKKDKAKKDSEAPAAPGTHMSDDEEEPEEDLIT